MSDNTFGDYEFAGWIPESERELIRGFWGIFGRTHNDWLNSHERVERCIHGPGKNGFGIPPNGATADYVIRDYLISEQNGLDVYLVIRGRYIHRWNNIGSLIDEDGNSHSVTTCERWIRVYQYGEEQK